MACNSWDGEREQDQQWKPRYKGYKKSKGRGGGVKLVCLKLQYNTILIFHKAISKSRFLLQEKDQNIILVLLSQKVLNIKYMYHLPCVN